MHRRGLGLGRREPRDVSALRTVERLVRRLLGRTHPAGRMTASDHSLRICRTPPFHYAVETNTVLKYSIAKLALCYFVTHMSLPKPLLDLRREEIIRRVQRDPRTVENLVLGVDRAAALDAIDWGQANFDEPTGTLSAEDRVLLYAYWNQRGHLEELSEAFQQMFSHQRPRNPFIVIDLGCGPFTAGLALAGQLDGKEEFDYIGVDRSRTMLELGEQLAVAADSMPDMPRVRRQWTQDVASIAWTDPPRWRPVVVVVSFLLASPTLVIEHLLSDLTSLLARLGRGEIFVLYTNSTREAANRAFPSFRDRLVDAGFQVEADNAGVVKTDRRDRSLRYALFHRGSQRKLALGGD